MVYGRDDGSLVLTNWFCCGMRLLEVNGTYSSLLVDGRGRGFLVVVDEYLRNGSNYVN